MSQTAIIRLIQRKSRLTAKEIATILDSNIKTVRNQLTKLKKRNEIDSFVVWQAKGGEALRLWVLAYSQLEEHPDPQNIIKIVKSNSDEELLDFVKEHFLETSRSRLRIYELREVFK